MRQNFQVLLLLCLIGANAHAQDEKPPSLNIGDPAPSLRVSGWIKGEPVQQFQKGRVYVLEFWATWCKPCRAAMPRLSTLAAKYSDRVSIIGIDVMETKKPEKVTAFVDSMSSQMNYLVAAEDSNFMVSGWLTASAEQGIPKTFVVNADGRLAWIGHPKDLDEVLIKIVNNDWDINAALAKRISDERLALLDDSINYELVRYIGDVYKPRDLGKPDSALLAIDEIIRNEPELKYAPRIACHTFSSLLKTNPHKAYEYGRLVLVTPSYEEPAFDAIIDVITEYSGILKLPVEIYRLCAEAMQLKFDAYPYPELVKKSVVFNNMSDWYWRAKERSKAIIAQQKAIAALKAEKGFHKTDLTKFESRLRRYRESQTSALH